MKSSFAIVDRCYSLAAYDHKRAWLESHGVTVYPDSEHTVSVNPFYSHAIGGLRLKVAAEQEELARDLLSQMADFHVASGEPAPVRSLRWPLAMALALGLAVGVYNGYRHGSPASGLYAFVLVGGASFITIAYIFKEQRRE